MCAQPTILVVDDNPGELEALARMLRLAKHNVVPAEGPDEAIACLEQSIQLVISDLRLGQHSGLELLRSWKQRHPETPFILVTAYGDVGSAVEAIKLGATDYITKPVHPAELLSRISKWLEAAGGDAQDAVRHATSDTRSGDPDGSEPAIRIPPGTSLEKLERAAIERALEEHGGNRTHAARALGISVRTLQRKLKAWRNSFLSLRTDSRSGEHDLLLATR